MRHLNQSRRAVSAMVVLFALLIGACSTSPSAYIEKGRKALDAKRYAEAEIDYEKATQVAPNLGDAWFGLGVSRLKQGKLNDAYSNLTRAVELLPTREDVAVALAEVALGAYMRDRSRPAELYQQVLTASTDLLRKNPDSYDGIRLKGYVTMIDHHYPDAIALLRRAERIKPGQGDVTEALIECLFQSGQAAEAEKLGTDYLNQHKDFAPVYDKLYGYLMQNHREPEAETLLKKKIEANPGVQSYRLQLARHYLDQNKVAGMNAVLDQIVSDPARFPSGRMTAGDFLATNNRLEDALRVFQGGARGDPKQKVAYEQRTAQMLAGLGKPDQAQAAIADILKQEPNNVEARALRVSINLDSGQPDNVQAAFRDLPQLLKERPNDAMLHYNMGRARLTKGNTDAALLEFQEAIRQNPTLVPARILAANISMQREDYVQARLYGDDLVRLTGRSPAARLLRAAALTGQGNYDDAARDIALVEKDFPDAVEPKLQLGALKLAQKKYAEAESIYRSAYEKHRQDLRPLQGLIETLGAENRYDAAIQLLNQERQRSPSPQIDAMLADAALRGNKLDLAVEQYSRIAEADPKSPFGHLRLGDAYLRKGDAQAAIAQLQAARSLTPNDPIVVAMLAMAFHSAGRAQEAQRAYRDALALQSGNPLVANNLAFLMAENGGNLDEALRLAQDAQRQQPSNLSIADTVGWIYLKKNLPDSAIQIFSNATEKDPGHSIYRFHLAMALVQKGDKMGARRECEAALAGQPSKADADKIRSLLATLS